MNKTIRNERRKLSATYINGLAIAVLAVGGFAPIVSLTQFANLSITAAVVVVSCIFASGALHLLARTLLGGLEE